VLDGLSEPGPPIFADGMGPVRYARTVPRLLVLLVLVLAVCGCVGGVLDGNSRPAVIPKLSELPSDPEKRDAVLDRSHEKERKAETIAAFAAALVGEAFSSSHSVTLGTSSTVDENQLFEKTRPARAPAAGSGSGSNAGSGATNEPAPDASQLTPWIKLK
jgi:hypothetical protein